MAETNGVPVSFASLTGDPDAEQRRLESMALAGLNPNPRAPDQSGSIGTGWTRDLGPGAPQL